VFRLLPTKLCPPFSDSWYVSVRYLHVDGKTHTSLHLDDWYVMTRDPAFSPHRQLQGWFMMLRLTASEASPRMNNCAA
jgi:hypothetical protein